MLTRHSAGRPAGRPSQKSVDQAVDQCARTCITKGRSTVRSTARELLLSVNGPGRPGGRPLGHSLVFGRLIFRSLFLTVRNQKSDCWRSTDCRISAELSPTASFLRLFIWGYFGLFLTRFEVSFQANFPYLSKFLSPLVLEPNTSISKGEFFKSVLKKIFIEFFTTNFIQVCLTHT